MQQTHKEGYDVFRDIREITNLVCGKRQKWPRDHDFPVFSDYRPA